MAEKKYKPEYIAAIRGLRNFYKFTGLTDKQVVKKIQELREALTITPEATLQIILTGNVSKTIDMINGLNISETAAKEFKNKIKEIIG